MRKRGRKGPRGNKEQSYEDINKKKSERIGLAVTLHILEIFDSNLSGDTDLIVEIIRGFPHYLQLQSWKSNPELLGFWAVYIFQNSI
jgi:hypothetical protein